MSALTELSAKMAQKRAELYKIQMQADTGKVDPVEGGQLYALDSEQIQEIKRRNEELIELNQQYQALEMADILKKNEQAFKDMQEPRRFDTVGGRPASVHDLKIAAMREDNTPISELFCKSSEYQRGQRRGISVSFEHINMKTLLQTSAGYAPANPRTGIVVMSAQRTPMIADLIPQDPTTLSSVKYMEETTFTNAAANTSEGTAKPEATLVYTERTAIVEKISVWIPATEEQLDDVDQMRNLLDNRLSLMILQKEETELLYGNGSGAIDGFLHNSSRATQAFSTNNADTVFMGMTKVRYTAFAEPSGAILHPNNWQTIRLAKTSGSGEYIMGAPSVNGGGAVNVAGVDTLWGKPVIVTPAITANQGLVGAFSQYAHISRRLGLRIDVSDSHDVYFVANKLAIRAEERLSLETYRAAAFCELTSLT